MARRPTPRSEVRIGRCEEIMLPIVPPPRTLECFAKRCTGISSCLHRARRAALISQSVAYDWLAAVYNTKPLFGRG